MCTNFSFWEWSLTRNVRCTSPPSTGDHEGNHRVPDAQVDKHDKGKHRVPDAQVGSQDKGKRRVTDAQVGRQDKEKQ